MSRIVPGIILLSFLFFSACKKTTELNEQNSPASVQGLQLPSPCTVKEDAARTSAARKNLLARTTGAEQTPIVLLLDFNGHQLINSAWNPEGTLNCPAVPVSLLSKEMKDYIFQSVVEDYSGFLVTITRNEAEYQAAAPERRMRCVITHQMTGEFGNVGGTAFVGSMVWADNTPCFVFCDPLLYNEKYIAGAVSHELGHTFGLHHQARYDDGCSMQEEYHSGLGDGALSWAPIMGLSYYKSLVTWHHGPSVLGCDQLQDDADTIRMIAGERDDDYAAALDNTAVLLPSTGNKNGFLEHATDKDAFKKNDQGSKRIRITSGGNSDLALEVYKLNGQLLAVYDATDCEHIDVVLTGKKYLRVMVSPNQPYVPANNGFGGYKIAVSAP